MKLERAEAEDFLFTEALLLDERRYDEWLELFTPEGLYWVPMQESGDPTLEASLFYDDALMRKKRVHQLLRRNPFAQRPRSRTVHQVTNVQVCSSDAESASVRCALSVSELREGDFTQLGLGEQRWFAGRCEYRFARLPALKIHLKKVVLINRDLPIENLSFMP